MADIILNKPEAGTQAVFEAAGDSRIDLNFPTDQATLERSGNDLIFRFDDGSTVVLRDFYTAYNKDSMPDFVIEGTPIAGEQFFTALNEPDLMPAAGPAANAASADGGRFREYADDALINGVNRLDGLDLSSNRAFFPERDPWGGLRGDDTPNYAPTLSVSGSLGVIERGRPLHVRQGHRHRRQRRHAFLRLHRRERGAGDQHRHPLWRDGNGPRRDLHLYHRQR